MNDSRSKQIAKLRALEERIRKCQEVYLGASPGMETDRIDVEDMIALMQRVEESLTKSAMKHFNEMWDHYRKKWSAYNAMACIQKMADGVFDGKISGYGQHMMDLEAWANLPPADPK